MLFSRNENLYQIKVTLSKDVNRLFKLDTGSAFTVISVHLLSGILGVDMNTLKDYLSTKKPTLCQSYSGHDQRLVPVYIRNVIIEDIVFDKFYCFVNIDNLVATPLIGVDLISACTVERSMAGYGFILTNLDQSAYAWNFQQNCCTTDVSEIFELCNIKSVSGISSLFNKAEGK